MSNQNQYVGILTCEVRGFHAAGDADDVWFIYHKSCYGQHVESWPPWRVEFQKFISREEAVTEEYVCDLCGEPLESKEIKSLAVTPGPRE